MSPLFHLNKILVSYYIYLYLTYYNYRLINISKLEDRCITITYYDYGIVRPPW